MADGRPNVLVVAGTDPCGCAGAAVDVLAIDRTGARASPVVTAVTVQDTSGVKGCHEVPVETVAAQIDAVMLDLGAQAAKTGMLPSVRCVEVVARALDRHACRNVVVDPVVRAGTGQDLVSPGVFEAIKRYLLPLARVVTPNLSEAAALADLEVEGLESMKRAGEKIASLGPEAVLVTGGHLAGDSCTDVLYHRGVFTSFTAHRLPQGDVHGTGCVLSSALAGGLAAGLDVAGAVELARTVVLHAINSAYAPVGKRPCVEP